MSDDMETTDALEHTHEDGTTHSHKFGDKDHDHDIPEEMLNPEGEAAAANVPNFNLADLAAVKQIIEVSSRRGAYNAAELSAVGTTYDRLMAFLTHHIPKPVAPVEDDDTPVAEIEPPVDNNAEPEIDRD